MDPVPKGKGMKRTLRLRRETLGSLSDADLGDVVGGYLFTREGGGLSCGGLLNCVVTLDGCVEIRSLHRCVDLTQLTCYCNTFPNC